MLATLACKFPAIDSAFYTLRASTKLLRESSSSANFCKGSLASKVTLFTGCKSVFFLFFCFHLFSPNFIHCLSQLHLDVFGQFRTEFLHWSNQIVFIH